MSANRQDYAAFARMRLVPAAANSLRAAFAFYQQGSDPKTQIKTDGTPAGIADRETERILREIIAANYPSHGIVGEELGVSNTTAEFVWVLDPLDGTKEFLAKENGWCSLIALLKNGKPVLGSIIDPLQDKIWDQNDAPVATGRDVPLEQAIIATTAPRGMFEGTVYEQGARLLFSRCAEVRERLNGLGFAYAASGIVDVAVENNLKLHDIAALLPALWARGAVCRDLDGNDYRRVVFDLSEAATARYSFVTSLQPKLVEDVLAVMKGRGA
ncbi:MAG: inositol monophosphatase family protein [Bdellovibrionales bacterium]